MTTTVFLRFADKAAAISAARAIMAAESVDFAGDPETVPLMGYTAGGTRFDLALVGGDGVYRQQTGTETRVIDGFGELVQPVFSAQPGFFVNLLWHGPEETIPEFGSARIYPPTPSQVFGV